MSLIATIAAAAAVATAPPPVAALPGLVVAHGGKIYVEGRAVARGAQPAWAPDGRRIAFTRAGEIYVADADGRNQRRLTTMSQPGAFPAWSPDGRTIAFARMRDVFSVSSRGGRVMRLTRSSKPWLLRTTPAYSPDGRTVAITATTDAFNSDVFLMRPDGSNLRRLTRSQGTHDRMGEEHAPDFSPDGKRIVFVSNRDGNSELYSIGVNGRNERRLTHTPSVAEDAPRYSSDGKRILYTYNGRIAHMSRAGGDVRQLGAGTSADWRAPGRSLLDDGRPMPTAVLRPPPATANACASAASGT
jgi:Tol biopolymer transport system component